MTMSALPDISISCIETRSYEKAGAAILRTLETCRDLPVKQLHWFSDAPCPIQLEIERRWGSQFLSWVEIEPFNPDISFNRQLSALTLGLIPKVVSSDFNLMIQSDGYAVNPAAWTNQFYEYDYIGASWPKEAEGRNVGNGGFSWRSKKLYQAIQEIQSRYPLENLLLEAREDETWIDKFGGRSIPEDNLICKVYRPILEKQYGIRFAPAKLADQFSIETHGDSPWLGKSFGFHGHLTGSFYINK
jgi:hypothetical protein